jgi:hypothetical protein
MNFKFWLESDETQFDHLPKLMSAKDIVGSVNLEDHDDLYGRFDFAGGDNKKLLNYKYKNAKERGLLDDILKNGIDTPIEIHVGQDGEQTLTQGHHRLAIALKHFPKRLLPVKYWSG